MFAPQCSAFSNPAGLVKPARFVLKSMLTARWSTALRRARLSAHLLAQRLMLPRRYRQAPLDELLVGLTLRAPREPTLSLDSLELDIRRVEQWVSRVPGVPDTCLYRALGRYAVLSHAGLPAVFVMGLQRGAADRDGHAWTEVFGRPFAESQSVADFAVTFRYPSEPKRTTR